MNQIALYTLGTKGERLLQVLNLSLTSPSLEKCKKLVSFRVRVRRFRVLKILVLRMVNVDVQQRCSLLNLQRRKEKRRKDEVR